MKNTKQPAFIAENKESHFQLSGKDLQHYEKQMKDMFRNTHLPAVLYKGQTIPRRILSDFSFLTSTPTKA